MTEIKVIYYKDDNEIPFMFKTASSGETITLLKIKSLLNFNCANYKFYFKNHVDEVGVVKEEIKDETAALPIFKNSVVMWLVTDTEKVNSDGDSTGTQRRKQSNRKNHNSKQLYEKICGHYDSSTITSISDGFQDSDDDCDDDCSVSQISTTTAETSVSRIHEKFRRKRLLSRSSSFSSISDTTATSCCNIITVDLNLERGQFLGISIVGNENDLNGGIYVWSIMEGGAVAQDGRIERGDMILQVNGHDFENMSNDEAVNILKQLVQTENNIRLVVAKCDPCAESSKSSYLSLANWTKKEPIQPIDPEAWVAHTKSFGAGLIQDFDHRPPSVSTLTSSNSSGNHSSVIEVEQKHLILNRRSPNQTPLIEIVRAMATPGNGLEVKDRSWLKITIPKAFLGSEAVDWVSKSLTELDRKEIKKLCTKMLKQHYIEPAVNKNSTTFSEHSYYTFNENLIPYNSSLLDGNGSFTNHFQGLSLSSEKTSQWPNHDCGSSGKSSEHNTCILMDENCYDVFKNNT